LLINTHIDEIQYDMAARELRRRVARDEADTFTGELLEKAFNVEHDATRTSLVKQPWKLSN